MTVDLAAFCAEFGIDEPVARSALKRRLSPDGGASPWYVRGLVAVGAWITAIAMVAFGVTLLALVLDDDRAFGVMLSLLGVACFAAGFAALRHRPDAVFRGAFATALSAAGIAMAVGGVAIETENHWVAAGVAVALAGLVAWKAPGQTLQGLASGLALTAVLAALVEEHLPFTLDIAALFLVAGVVLWLRPPRIDLRPTAFVLLLAAPLLSIFAWLFVTMIDIELGGWGARAVHIALFLWLVSILWPRVADPAGRVGLGVFAAGAAVACLLLPPGGSGALVIMTLAFVLGSRPLALLGILLQAYFVWQFYYALRVSLLDKSLLLMAVGAVTVACWWLIVRRRPREARP